MIWANHFGFGHYIKTLKIDVGCHREGKKDQSGKAGKKGRRTEKGVGEGALGTLGPWAPRVVSVAPILSYFCRELNYASVTLTRIFLNFNLPSQVLDL